ncbi:MAG: glycosyltransferase [Treponema sp.]|nr:glycosyltransferase [Treponema sp.]
MKVAIIHYWLVTMRGGEKMLEALLELFPEADIFTHVYDPSSISDLINSHSIYTSGIQKFPFAKKFYQKYLSFMPKALDSFNIQNYDLVISSEAGPAKGVVPNPDAFHLCYCHSPMRYIWDMYHEYHKRAGFFTRFFMKRLIPRLRLWDVCSANLVDRFITNSTYSAGRIKRYYNRDAAVVYGPASIEKYLSVPRNAGEYYLLAGQITEYKRADIAIEACAVSGRKLVVAGSGMSKKDIRRWEKTGVISFRDRVSDAELISLFSGARALIFPGIEDMGLIPIEANAAGCPVIAYGKGGVLDTIKDGITGIFFYEQTPVSLIKAIDRFEAAEKEMAFSRREQFSDHVRQFSKEAFKERVLKIIEERKRI